MVATIGQERRWIQDQMTTNSDWSQIQLERRDKYNQKKSHVPPPQDQLPPAPQQNRHSAKNIVIIVIKSTF